MLTPRPIPAALPHGSAGAAGAGGRCAPASALPASRAARHCARMQIAKCAPAVAASTPRSDSAAALRVGRRRTACEAVKEALGTVAEAPDQPEYEAIEVEGVTVHEVCKGVHLLRGVCTNRLKYEVEYSLKRGTTDNSYLLKGDGASVLVDVPFESYADDWVSAVKALTPLSELSHIVLTHLDPKSVPCLSALLRDLVPARKGCAPTELVMSNPAARLLQSSMGSDTSKAELLSGVRVSVARAGQSVAVGSSGRVLDVLPSPTPRWPDLMLAYDATSATVFTSKLFSAHVAPPTASGADAVGDAGGDAGGWEAFGDDWRHFFECMIAPQMRQVAPALEKLALVPVPRSASTGASGAAMRGGWLGRGVLDFFRELTMGSNAPSAAAAAAPGGSSGRAASFLAPMHGPVVVSALTQLLREYRSWTDEQLAAASTSSATVFYASAYGNTTALAQAISRGITKAGVAVEMLNLETEGMDAVVGAIKRSKGFVIGSPTLGGHMPTQVQVALGAVIRQSEAKRMPCGVFGSFGWSGEAVDEMEQKLRDAGFGFSFKPIRVKFRPTAKDLQTCEESGRELALGIKRQLKAREASVSAGDTTRTLASSPTLAMGRVVGSLAVVAAKDEDSTSAMLASWVSQASFNPPGLTVAVKKDRAMEPLLVAGARFAVSMVPEAEERAVMRALARAFAPGEDRLASLQTAPGALTGAPTLASANAVMECQVVSRMEAGDHWLVYATVEAGQVLDNDANTAVHHRKVGNHY